MPQSFSLTSEPRPYKHPYNGGGVLPGGPKGGFEVGAPDLYSPAFSLIDQPRPESALGKYQAFIYLFIYLEIALPGNMGFYCS
jgi:hypothetical protein